MTIASPEFEITSAGITAPTYDQILEYYQEKAKEIFGSDINIDNDTQDGQLIALVALALHECNCRAVNLYSAYNPQTAHGVALDGAVKTNGLARESGSKSTADVLIGGIAGTVITNGVVRDTIGRDWDLPDTVTIPSSGAITVTATAQEEGKIYASAGSITIIGTPIYGWNSVTNQSESTVGKPTETDTELRSRQSLSTMQPSVGLWDGLIASLRQIDGVKSASGRHNDTGSTSEDGIPAHSVACVVSGGEVDDIIETIYKKKSQGVNTYGSISRTYLDSIGGLSTIRFSRPTSVRIRVAITVRATETWLSTVEDAIKSRIANYVNSLGIGVSVNIPRVLASSMVTDDGKYDTDFNVEAITINSQALSVAIAWNQIANCELSDVTVTVV